MAQILWSDRDESAARACLRTELWRVRSWLESQDVDPDQLLIASKETLMLRTGGQLWLDLAEVERWLTPLARGGAQSLEPEQVAGIAPALRLFRGELLAGLSADWIFGARQQLQRLEILGLERMMVHYGEQHETQRAIRYGEALLERDPLLEQVYRELMLFDRSLGDRNSALRRYHDLESLLASELGVEPMPETKAIYRRLMDCPGDDATDAPTTDDVASTPNELTQARQSVLDAATAASQIVPESGEFDPRLRQILPQLLAVQRCLEEAAERMRVAIERIGEAGVER
ncbi:MAG: bacterial transcriptional activator domain-containing protein [Acidobacteriota bacterium]